MYNSWTIDLSDSARALLTIKDTILKELISGEIHSIESSKDAVLILFDKKSGIDYIRENEEGLQGIAARVQWKVNYKTFTIRKTRHTGTETEYEKRKNAIKSGYIYPAFTMQAYFDNRIDNNLLSIAMMRTLNLYEFIDKYPGKVYQNKSDNEFIYIFWNDLKNKYNILIRPKNG